MANHLFIIGIDQYAHPDHKTLVNAVRDVTAFRDVLYTRYTFEREHTVELFDASATNENIQNTFATYISNLNDNDNLVIYFSGHGALVPSTDTGYWLPYDATKSASTCISNDLLLSWIRKIKAKHVFIISDCCFSWSILLTEIPKALQDYSNTSSRWALTSGKGLTYDQAGQTNSDFANSILSLLNQSTDNLRIGQLIEHVKHVFAADTRQTAQGSPLRDTNHKGGEFLFELREEVRNPVGLFHGYPDFLTLLLNYKPNGKFVELSSIENKNDRIGYTLIEEEDTVLKQKHYYLLLFQGITISRTATHFKNIHESVYKKGNLVILTPKIQSQSHPSIRKSNIINHFNTQNVFFIDEFLREQCLAKPPQPAGASAYMNLNNFILPAIEADGVIIPDPQSFINNWLTTNGTSILVLKGPGGSGKTTLAEHITDNYSKYYPSSGTIFIESHVAWGEISRQQAQNASITAYNFYEALCSRNGDKGTMLSEALFRMNLEAGNFLLVIDGLDEVISKASSYFNVSQFLNDLQSFSSEASYSKVIITCRTYFWDKSESGLQTIETLNIRPFNHNQSNRFFQASFKGDEGAVRKSMRFAELFRLPSEGIDSYFHPYVLDLIRSIVDKEGGAAQLHDSTFASDILEPEHPNDYVVFKVCARELNRVSQISVDEQLLFFTQLAVKHKGSLRLSYLDEMLLEALNKPLDLSNREAIKSHPLLMITGDFLKLRYDFLVDYFKSIYLSQHIRTDGQYSEVGPQLMNVLDENHWYGSSLIGDVTNRFVDHRRWQGEDLLKILGLLEQMNDPKFERDLSWRRSVAGLFNACLAINVKLCTGSIEANTELLALMFGRPDGSLHGVHLIGTFDEGKKIRFDFSGRTVIDSYLDGYHDFWECSYDEKSKFVNSTITKIRKRDKNALPISLKQFDNCVLDSSILEAFRVALIGELQTDEEISEFIADFIRMFRSYGRFQPQTIDRPQRGRDGYNSLRRSFANFRFKNVDFDTVLAIFVDVGLVERVRLFAEEKAQLRKEHLADIERYVSNRTHSSIIKAVHEAIKHRNS